MEFTYEVGDRVKYYQHDGLPWGGVIERRVNLGVPSYWIDNHKGWISESKIIKLWTESRFENFDY